MNVIFVLSLLVGSGLFYNDVATFPHNAKKVFVTQKTLAFDLCVIRCAPGVLECYIDHPIYERDTHDKNWVGRCWKNRFTKVSELADYFSPKGVPISKFTKQTPGGYINWIWNPVFFEWYGDDFDLRIGHGFEIEATEDAVLGLRGFYFPDSVVELDNGMNWVTIPDNTIYVTISDIADELSPDGAPVVEFIHMLPGGLYEGWTYFGDPFFWTGTDWTLVPGEAVQFNCTKDTVWDPIEE